MKKGNNKLSRGELVASFNVSNVYIGALVGPQLVAGTYAVFYYLQAGAWSLILPFIGVGIIGVLCAFAAEIARRFKLYDYGTFAKKMYNGNKVLCVVFDIFIIVTLVTGAASYLAMSGTFFTELTGAASIVGMILIGAISILVALKDSIVRAAGSVMSIIMLIGFIAVLILICTLYGDRMSQTIGSWYVPETASFGEAVKKVAEFGFLSAAMSVTLCCVEQPIVKKKQSIWIAIFTTLIGGSMMSLSCMYFLPFLDEIMGVEIPLIHLMNSYLSMHAPWLPAVYYILMLVAVVSSMVPNIFMVTTRLGNTLKTEKRFKTEKSRLLLFGIIFVAVAIGIATFGLSNIMSYGFSFLAYLGIPLVCIPTCIIWPIKFHKERKARLAAGLTPEPDAQTIKE